MENLRVRNITVPRSVVERNVYPLEVEGMFGNLIKLQGYMCC